METITVNSKSNSIDDIDELGGLKKNYLLLKRKICRTHELIRQYNDKVKECERINIELESSHTELKTLKTNYNGVLGKVIKLELQNTEYAKQISSMSSKIKTQEIKIAGDQQLFHQLSCKLKEVEDKHDAEKLQWEVEKSVLKEKIKEVEHSLKVTKNINSSMKKINKPQMVDKGTNYRFNNIISRVNVGVNTTKDSIITRADKNVMTNLSIGTKKSGFYSLLCDKCESILSDPVKAICKTMTKTYEMVEAIPSCSSNQNSTVPASNISSKKDCRSDKRLNSQNPSKDDESKSNNSLLSKTSSSLKEDSNPSIVRDEISVNSVQQITTETLTPYIDDLKDQMKRLEKKLKKQSRKKESLQPDYNYFQPLPPYRNYLHNEMFNYNPLLNMMEKVLKKVNNTKKTTRTSKKNRKKKHESIARKIIFKKTKRKQVHKIVSVTNNAWKVDSIASSFKQSMKTDNSASENHLDRSPSPINNDLILDNDASNINVGKDICLNNIIKTSNDNLSKSNSSYDKQCLSSTVIEEVQPVRDTQSILQSLDFKSNNPPQHKINIVTDKDIINKLNTASSKASILNADISTNDKFNVSDINKQKSISFIEESDNTENTVEDISNPIIKDPIDFTSNISANNNTVVKNCKRKLQIFENELNQSSLIKDLPTMKKNNEDMNNVEGNETNIIENTRENILEKVINNKSNLQIINSDVVVKKKRRIAHENLNAIQEMDYNSDDEVAQENILDCTSLNEKENKSVEKKDNNKRASSMVRHNIIKNNISKPVCSFVVNKKKNKLLGRLIKLQRSRSINVGNLKLFDSDEPITEEDKNIDQKKCVPKQPACNKNNKIKKISMKNIDELKETDEDFIEDLLTNTLKNETQIMLTDKSKTLMENLQVSANMNESKEDECLTVTISPLKDSKVIENEDRVIDNNDEKARKENIKSCLETISSEENKMIKSVYLDCSEFKLISPLKERYVIENLSEKSSDKEINEPVQDEELKLQMLNRNNIDTSIHPNIMEFSKIKSGKRVLETSRIIEEEFHLESEINIKEKMINKIPLEEKGDNLIIKADEQHNSTVTTKEKSNELMKNTSINNPTFKLLNPSKDNQISNNTSESSLENNLNNSLQNVAEDSRRLSIRGLGALIDSKHMVEVKRIPPKKIQMQELEMESNKMEKDLSINSICKNINVQATMSIDLTKKTMHNENLNIQLNNGTIVNNLKVDSANNTVNEEHPDNDNLISLVNPTMLLNNYLSRNIFSNGKKNFKQRLNIQQSYTKIDNFVHDQIRRIINNNDWSMPVHRDVVDKLSSTCTARIIAKNIVTFMLEKSNDNLDKTYTPPAPIMTPSQQKIVALLVDLEVKLPTVIKWVQAGTEYKIFRLNSTPTFHQIENLIRLYIALTRIQKNREKLRMVCCDALYCLGFSAIPIIYTILTCWPEVMPHFSENIDMLPKCIVHCVMSLQSNNSSSQALKNFLKMYYNYKPGSHTTKNLVEESLKCFERNHCKENSESLRTVVILLAKKEGISWTHKNIIKKILLPNIVNRKYTFVREVFILLGNLMRTFPKEDKDGIVKNIIEQLIDLLESGEGSHDQQEGIASALLSLTRHDLVKVINSVMKWNPKEPLRTSTIDQYYGIFGLRAKCYWIKHLKLAKGKKFKKKHKKNITPQNNSSP